MKASWGALSRVTYMPVELRGERTVSEAPWVNSADVFSFITHDTQFAWALAHPGSEGARVVPPQIVSPSVDARHEVDLKPGETAEALFVLGVGVEEFSAAHSAKALTELLDRSGAQGLIRQSADWCRKRTRTTGQSDLNLSGWRQEFSLFTTLYAWGNTIDTEQLVGVTSRSPLYYVSAAYWDRDAMLWIFPLYLIPTHHSHARLWTTRSPHHSETLECIADSSMASFWKMVFSWTRPRRSRPA